LDECVDRGQVYTFVTLKFSHEIVQYSITTKKKLRPSLAR